ncbi:hypothetical protein BLNAU_7960 [Blattamonas nauphoetae]|uniref:Uncharacterized protein n=1 Tax=Blattamonas nauphoetae TaxID=2049346 RepID=A0ABQ9Y080_9EUKA|nr:hypothetical protein BLNAU_7960 [Blattamonas nauphoetae]
MINQHSPTSHRHLLPDTFFTSQNSPANSSETSDDVSFQNLAPLDFTSPLTPMYPFPSDDRLFAHNDELLSAPLNATNDQFMSLTPKASRPNFSYASSCGSDMFTTNSLFAVSSSFLTEQDFTTEKSIHSSLHAGDFVLYPDTPTSVSPQTSFPPLDLRNDLLTLDSSLLSSIYPPFSSNPSAFSHNDRLSTLKSASAREGRQNHLNTLQRFQNSPSLQETILPLSARPNPTHSRLSDPLQVHNEPITPQSQTPEITIPRSITWTPTMQASQQVNLPQMPPIQPPKPIPEVQIRTNIDLTKWHTSLTVAPNPTPSLTSQIEQNDHDRDTGEMTLFSDDESVLNISTDLNGHIRSDDETRGDYHSPRSLNPPPSTPFTLNVVESSPPAQPVHIVLNKSLSQSPTTSRSKNQIKQFLIAKRIRRSRTAPIALTAPLNQPSAAAQTDNFFVPSPFSYIPPSALQTMQKEKNKEKNEWNRQNHPRKKSQPRPPTNPQPALPAETECEKKKTKQNRKRKNKAKRQAMLNGTVQGVETPSEN